MNKHAPLFSVGLVLLGALVLPQAASRAGTVSFTSDAVIEAADATYEGSDLLVQGCTVTVNGAHAFNSVSLEQGGVITHSPATASEEYSLRLTIAGSLVVDSASKIDVSGRGYLGNYTLGNTTTGAATGLSGGSYGGLGSSGNGAANWVYGDFRNPNELGAGGAGDATRAGAGGGLIRITAATAQIDGVIMANGAAGWNWYAVGGPGSGGGIRLDVGMLSGTGQVSANGGAAAGGTGSGGGGRIAIYCQTVEGFELATKVTAHAGTGGNGPGAVGTVYLKKVGGMEQLLLATHGSPAAAWTPLGRTDDTAVQVEEMTVVGAGVTVAPAQEMPVAVKNLSLLSGAVLTHRAATAAQEYSLRVTVTNALTIDAASTIDVSGRGYLGNYTLGNTTTRAATGLSGASYGGLGRSSGGSANWVYGDFRNPNELGTGGAGDATRTGAGGGLVRISAGTAQIDGAILAEGMAGWNWYAVGGPGSGGGIRIDAGTLRGSGKVSANGGAAAGGTGAAGGGRVAIYYQTLEGFDLATNVTAHAGNGGEGPGALGTVYWKQVGGGEQLLLATHGTSAGVWTPLGKPGDTSVEVENLTAVGAGIVAAPGQEMPVATKNLSLLSGAVLTHRPATATNEYSLRVTVTNDLTIDASSTIDVSGRGCLGNLTLGNSTNGAATGFSGASYGGLGSASGGSANWVYGDYRNPNELGSGGAGDATRAGAGGGLIRLVAGTAQIDGTIQANGTGGINWYAVGGPGSGGGIRIDVGTLRGRGMVSANGGQAAGGTGSGGGGRVAIYYGVVDGFGLATNVTAHGGTGGNGPGGVGTVYLKPENELGLLFVSSHGASAGVWTPLGMTSDTVFSVEHLLVAGTNVVAAPAHEMPIQAVSIAITNGGNLTHQFTTAAKEYSLRLTIATDLTVDPASVIDVSGRGYLGNYTRGNTTTGGAAANSGGSYGGLGYSVGGSANVVYGDYRNPNEPGSGGGGDATRTGTGGGLVRITAASAQIEGKILANGNAGRNWYAVGGSGSGGGVFLSVGTLTGSGQITADGGAGGPAFGSGGGGRIAVAYQTLQGFDLANRVMARGGSGGDGAGGVGSVYLKQAGSPGQLLLVNHGSTTGSWTPLGSPTDASFEADDLVISGTNTVVAPAGGIPIHARSISLRDGAVLTVPSTTSSQEYSLVVSIDNSLVVDGSSKIDVSGTGYRGSYTLGNQTEGGATGTSGGSYGGLGYDAGNGSANATYGDYQNPNELGSGGGGDATRTGAGGGLVRLRATGAQIDGGIYANGLAGRNWYAVGGSGSGGGIRLDVGTLSGTGQISADGGQGGGGFGAGAGGRVAIYYQTVQEFDLTGKVTAHGGTQGDGSGAVGTVYLKPQGNPAQLLLLSHGHTTGMWTPLGRDNDTTFQVDDLVIAGTNVVAAPQHEMPIHARSVALTNGGMLTHRPITAAQEYSLRVNVTNGLAVDASSRIDVSERGYLGGYTVGNTSEGGARGNSGGSYGGLGYAIGGGQPNATYGDERNPNTAGSGGGGDLSRTGRGGGVARITADTAQIDGAILANGGGGRNWYAVGGAGSGGSILLNAGTIAGDGILSAGGGFGGGGFGAGGGGRVAVYSWKNMALAVTNVTAAGGTGGSGPGEAGSVVFSSVPVFVWENVKQFLHGTVPIGWNVLGLGQGGLTVQLSASRAGTVHAVGTSVNSYGALLWDTRTVPDGAYELVAIYSDLAGQASGRISRQVLVNNALVWHSGSIGDSQTWEAGVVHVVDGKLVIASGGMVTIQPGAIVKFTTGASIAIRNGAALNALATAASPIILTSFKDDTAGGDSNLDGDVSQPLPGDWNGISVATTGQFNRTSSVEMRYLMVVHGGELAGNEGWEGTFIHTITSTVTVPSGATLTIAPGAVLKFAFGAGLNVSSGGTLNALGTLAQPITFTSIKDDSVGGDSNQDADLTQSAAGDWVGLNAGTAAVNLRYCNLRYGGNTGGGAFASGVIIVNSGTLACTGCLIESARYDGLSIYGNGGSASLTNCLLRDVDRAIWAWGGGNVRLLNCTFDDNVAALVQHGGSTITAENCIIANSIQGSVTEGACTLRYCDLWSKYPNSSNPNVIGQDGNISADPRFVNAAQKNYRLKYGSACIDAADGLVAPPSDFMGAPRYSDPRALNRTGTPASNGAYVDLGPFEFVENAASAIDLVASAVSGPAQVTAGDTVVLTWTDSNRGSGTATGPWHDAVYLLPRQGGSPIFVTEVLVGEAEAIGAAQSIPVTAKVPVVGAPKGKYLWQVQANSRGDVFEGVNWTNNTASASNETLLTVPELVIGGEAVVEQLTAAGQSRWFMVVPQASADVQVNLQAAAAAGSLELYLGRGYIPTREHYDSTSSLGTTSTASVLAANASAQAYYVTVYAAAVTSSSVQVTLSSSALDFSVTGVNPRVAGTGGTITLKVNGGRLREDMTYSLVGAGGTPHRAVSVWQAQGSVFATFSTELAIGSYALLVQDAVRNRSLADAVSLVAGIPGTISYSVVMPSFIRWGQVRRAAVNYRNTGNTDVPAPLMIVSVTGGTLTGLSMDTRAQVDLGSLLMLPDTGVQVLGINPDGPAGTLPPGFEGTFYFDVRANTGVRSVTLSVNEMLAGQTLDWSSFKASLKPPFLSSDAWDVIYANLTARLGSSTDQYGKVLCDNASYLSELGQITADVGRLLGFEYQKANAFGALGLRYATGIFGRGFANPFNMTAQSDASGNVCIGCPSGFRKFTRISAGVYQAGPGDTGVLTDASGGYRLDEADGFVTIFNSSGKISYLEQANGWRVTLNYSTGRLTGISNSQGDTVTYNYDAQGRVASIRDAKGKTTTLAYDASGEHLLSATDAAGTTQFSYLTGQGASREHALSTITFPDGRHLYLEYDALGRISRRMGDLSTGVLKVAYGTQANVTLTDGAGSTYTCAFDDLMNPSFIRDPLGRSFAMTYDQWLNPKLLVDAEGNSQSLSHDALHNLTGIVDWLGRNHTMSYSSANKLMGYLNPASVKVAYSYDQGRNLTGVLFDDQTQMGFTRGQWGQLTGWTNRRGQQVRYDINALSLVTGKHFTASQETFAYDSHRNLARIVDARGTNTYTYDAADRLIQVRYASGHTLSYTYDAYGRRTQLLADDGYTVKYNYDGGGRMTALRDKNDAIVVSYSYDAADRLVREDRGNQTYTTYEYDLAGQIAHVSNRNPSGTVLSRFDYTYDAEGRPASMVTLDGAWTYQHDAAGQMTRATFASTSAGVPSQEIQIAYDSTGNRTQATVNGVVSSYLTDRMDRYLTAGAARYAYDADGNLTSITDGSGVTSLTYDELNRLTGVKTPADTWGYEYDSFGFRCATTHNGARTEHVVDPLSRGEIISDYRSGALSGHYAFGLGLVGRVESGGSIQYHSFDFLGNTAEVTGPSGAVLNAYRYRPFGDLISSQETVQNPFTYGGRWGVFTDGSGLSLMGIRCYRTVDGRFITEEPVGRRYPNAYAYAFNSPALYRDPTGLAGQNGLVNWLISLIPFSSTFTGMHATWTTGMQGHSEYQSNIDALCSNPNAPLYGDSVNGGQVGGMYLPALQQAGQTVMNAQVDVAGQAFSSVNGSPSQFSPEGMANTAINTGLGAMKDQAVQQIDNPKGGSKKGNPPAKPPGVPGKPGDSGTSDSGGSTDPNDLVGPVGYGDAHWVRGGSRLLYTIDFENLPTVTLPAQRVDIDNQLDPNLDWGSFELQQVGFNNVVLDVPPGLMSFTANAAVATDPNPVSVVVSFDPIAGKLTSRIQSIDLVTGLLVEDPFAGFLPPNDAQHRGEGFLSYVVRTKETIVSGAQIRNQASIVFDVNAALLTPIATNRVDVNLPASAVSALPAVTTSNPFLVSWSGSDLGAGISAYTVYVSEDNGAWTAWLANTEKTSAAFMGKVGHTYSFCSLVKDNVGYVETKAPQVEATTRIADNVITVIPPLLSGTLNPNGLFQLTFTGTPNLTNVVEVSMDLIQWTEAAALTSTNGTFLYEDAGSKDADGRFYRVRVQSP